jgi:hypothetical protein
MEDVGSWYILRTFALFYGHSTYIFYGLLVYFKVIWYIFPRVGILHQEKSGNPCRSQPPSTNGVVFIS